MPFLAGLAIARQRIELEKQTRSGSLDLGDLGLTELPEELWELSHLERLDLGRSQETWFGRWRSANEGLKDLPIAGGKWRHLPRLRHLSLPSTGLTEGSFLNGIEVLGSLQSLKLGSTCGRPISLEPLAGLSALQSLDCYSSTISSLRPLAGLKSLRELILPYVEDEREIIHLQNHAELLELAMGFGGDGLNLDPLSGLTKLRVFNLGTRAKDLRPLARLKHLEEVRLFHECDLEPIAELPLLRCLDPGHGTKLDPLVGKTSLRELTVNSGTDLQPLSLLTSLESLHFGCYALWDLTSLTHLTSLKSLHVEDGGVDSLEPLAGLSGLERIYFYKNHIHSLEPLSDLKELKYLSVRRETVESIKPLAGLTSLEELDVMCLDMASLEPLAGLIRMRDLHCGSEHISDLKPLANLRALEKLAVYGSQVSSLEPLAGLSQLRELRFNCPQVWSLEPLSGLTRLQKLEWGHRHFEANQVRSLEPLKKLTELRELKVENSPEIRSLKPLADLRALESVTCSGTQVSSLEPLGSLSQLKELISLDCPIRAIPGWVFENEVFGQLCLSTSGRHPIGEILAEALSKDEYDNCLSRLFELRPGKVGGSDREV